MAFVVRPATAERSDDVATILAPKREGAQGCWCLPYRLTPREDEARRAPARARTVEAVVGDTGSRVGGHPRLVMRRDL